MQPGVLAASPIIEDQQSESAAAGVTDRVPAPVLASRAVLDEDQQQRGVRLALPLAQAKRRCDPQAVASARLFAERWADRTRAGWRRIADFIAVVPAAPHRNIELKARDPLPAETLAACVALDAEDRGELWQRDTYLSAREGVLKLREQHPGAA
jgi:hypothetical protein